jgi:hypothetical protein
MVVKIIKNHPSGPKILDLLDMPCSPLINFWPLFLLEYIYTIQEIYGP